MRPPVKRTASRPASRVVTGASSQARQVGESHARLVFVAAFFSLCFAALSMRLVEVSLMGSSDLPFKKLVEQPELLIKNNEEVDASKLAAAQQVIRREIIDRNGMVLATSIKTASLVANPSIIRHEAEVAKNLATIFRDESAAAFLKKLTRKDATFLYVRRHLTPAQQEAVNNLGVPGLFFEPDMRRVYPYGALFSHVLGYVGVDNQGLSGIEKHFDYRLNDSATHAPLQLALDLRVQSILRDELAASVKQFSAIGATGIVMDIATGEIIAMSNLPEFDPNRPSKAEAGNTFNRATLGAYEMGSTFKTFTVAAALEHKVATLHGGYDASRPIQISKFTIRDSHPENRWLTVPEIYAYSSNIGMAKMAMDVGGKRQRAFLSDLGLFDKLSLEVPEIATPLVPREWRDLTAMTVSYGHGISVSPLHLVRAVAAVAGDGRVKTPTLIKDGNADAPLAVPVVSPATVRDMRTLMRLVVMAGTGKSAEAPGYAVGGKTGTAEKTFNGAYKQDAKLASFVGVFPAREPKYAILVMVDEPKGTTETHGYATGGWVAAPVVGRVVQRMAPLLGMRPDFNQGDAAVEALWAGIEARQKSRIAPVKSQQGAVHAASF